MLFADGDCDAFKKSFKIFLDTVQSDTVASLDGLVRVQSILL